MARIIAAVVTLSFALAGTSAYAQVTQSRPSAESFFTGSTSIAYTPAVSASHAVRIVIPAYFQFSDAGTQVLTGNRESAQVVRSVRLYTNDSNVRVSRSLGGGTVSMLSEPRASGVLFASASSGYVESGAPELVYSFRASMASETRTHYVTVTE